MQLSVSFFKPAAFMFLCIDRAFIQTFQISRLIMQESIRMLLSEQAYICSETSFLFKPKGERNITSTAITV